MKDRALLIVVFIIFFGNVLVLGSPEASAMSIRGNITCISNSRDVEPGGTADFLLNVSVNTSGLGENYQGVQVTLFVDDGSLDSNLSVDVVNFNTGGGMRMVFLNLSVPRNARHGQVRVVVTGQARPLIGPVTGIRSFDLEPVECFVNVTRTRGVALYRKLLNLDLYREGEGTMNVTIENLGNSWENVHLEVLFMDGLLGIDAHLSENTLNLSPFQKVQVALIVSAGLDASFREHNMIIAANIDNDPEGDYDREIAVKVTVMIKPELAGKPFEAEGDPIELERSTRDIDVLIRYTSITLGNDRMSIKVSGRATGPSLARVKLYMVFRNDISPSKEWQWEPIGITKNTPQWNKWESDLEMMDTESYLPGYLRNMTTSDNVYFVAIGLDPEYSYNYDIVAKNKGEMGSLDYLEVPIEAEDEVFTIFSMDPGMLILVGGIVVTFCLLLLILVVRTRS
ncbi:MAG: hypothetical protein QGH39_08510 [Candidatus Thermoplasmatota archaeon]|jgi:hypothetical protein|nr:hypothetical protein [Candidatus Thermoplasmatota archaeon]